MGSLHRGGAQQGGWNVVSGFEESFLRLEGFAIGQDRPFCSKLYISIIYDDLFMLSEI